MIGIRVKGCFGKYGARACTLEDKGRPVALVPDQMGRALFDEVYDTHLIAEMEQILPRRECEFVPPKVPELRF